MTKKNQTQSTAIDPQEKMKESVKIDFDSIPEHVRDDLARATLEAVQEFLKQPGSREYLDNKKALRKAKPGAR